MATCIVCGRRTSWHDMGNLCSSCYLRLGYREIKKQYSRCWYCNDLFHRNNDESKFCSEECKNSYMEFTIRQRERRICLKCGKFFRNQRHTRTYCSDECRKSDPKHRDKVLQSDSYIKTLLITGSTTSRKDIPPELIELKRAELLLKRSIRKESKACQQQGL